MGYEFLLVLKARLENVIADFLHFPDWPFASFSETVMTVRGHLPPLFYIIAAIVVFIAISFLLTETIIGLCIGFVLWKIGITRSWGVVEFRAFTAEVTIENFELGPDAIKSIYVYWKRILPLELLYIESGTVRLDTHSHYVACYFQEAMIYKHSLHCTTYGLLQFVAYVFWHITRLSTTFVFDFDSRASLHTNMLIST